MRLRATLGLTAVVVLVLASACGGTTFQGAGAARRAPAAAAAKQTAAPESEAPEKDGILSSARANPRAIAPDTAPPPPETAVPADVATAASGATAGLEASGGAASTGDAGGSSSTSSPGSEATAVASTESTGGDGAPRDSCDRSSTGYAATAAKPAVLVRTSAELSAALIDGAHVRLAADISLAGGWSTIPLIGHVVLDGGGHTLTGLREPSVGGLLGVVTCSFVKDLRLQGVDLAPSSLVVGYQGFGVLAAQILHSRIENVELSDVKIRIPGRMRSGGVIGRVEDSSVVAVRLTGLDLDLQKSPSGNDVVVDWVGGLAGEVARGSRIEASRVEGRIRAQSTGGLVGSLASGAEIVHAAFVGWVEGSTSVGGLVGTSSGSISRAYADVTATAYGPALGGLVGTLGRDGRITDSYAIGALDGYQDVGGLVGGVLQNTVITRAYAAVEVPSSCVLDCGGLIGGYAFAGAVTGAVTGSYWDVDAAGYATSFGAAAPLAAAEAQTASAYLGWDFTNVWRLAAGMAHPSLRAPEE